MISKQLTAFVESSYSIYNSQYERNSTEVCGKEAYKHYIELSIPDSGDFEVPGWLAANIKGKIGTSAIPEKFKYFMRCFVTMQATTSTAFIKILRSTNKLTKIVIPGLPDKVYYGSKGMILDASFNPILMSTVTVHRTGRKLRFTKIAVHISNSIFNETDIISKYIVNKLIPAFGSTQIYVRDIDSEITPTIIIDRFDDVVSKVIPPNVKVSNETFNDLVLAHIDDFKLA